MEPFELRRTRRADRRARKAPVEVQTLETRQLLTWTPLGFSLPDLSISGIAAPVGAYGQEIAVTVTVQNFGTASIYEPLALEPLAPSTADAPPSTVAVYASRSPIFGRGAFLIGTIDIPAIRQNSYVEVTDTVRLPDARRGLPPVDGTLYLFFRADATRQVNDIDRSNNQTRHGVPVRIAPPLPDLYGLALDLPPVMQPGDFIAPAIKVVNYGTTNPNTQAPFTIALVASTDPFFGPGDLVLGTYTVLSLPPLALVPMQTTVLGDVNVQDPINVLTIGPTAPVQLPTTPGTYFVGVVVDPENIIQEITEIGRGPDPRIEPIQPVGPRQPHLPPAGVLSPPADPNNQFPIPPFGRLPTIYEGIIEEPPIIVDPPVVTPLALTPITFVTPGSQMVTNADGAAANAFTNGGPLRRAFPTVRTGGSSLILGEGRPFRPSRRI